MLFSDISVLMPDFTVAEHKYVCVSGDKITYIGDSPIDDAEVYSGANRLLMPAFVNSHSHTPMTLLRGIGGGLPLSRWLTEAIFPFEAQLTADDVYFGTMLGIAEMLRFGIVSTTDMYYKGEAIAKAVEESGVKFNLSMGVTEFGDGALKDNAIFKEGAELFKSYHNAFDGRLKIDMSLHAEYTSTPKVVGEMAEYCQGIGANMHIHLSETEKEHLECIERRGMTPAAYFNNLGVFKSKTTAAHCVWLSEEDMAILAENGVTVASCPVSNLKLMSGVCDTPSLIDSGVNVALGTDSVASNNSLNMFEEMKLFSILKNIPAKNALEAATISGAMAQGRFDCGAIKEGAKADLIVLDTSAPYFTPCTDFTENLVFSAQGSDVVLTMSDGKVLYRDGEYTTLDIEKIKAEAASRTAAILNKLH